jgi:hypothetical protein
MALQRPVAFVIVAAAAAVPALRAQTAADVQAAESFRNRLVAAIAAGDRRQVASFFAFPMRVTATLPYPIPIEDRAAFLRMYELLFTSEMRCALQESRVPRDGQRKPPWPMLVADGVVSLANGRVLATRTPAGLRITSMTILGAPGGSGGRTVNAGLRWGSGKAQYAGRLALSDRDRYVISARKGDLLQARLERFPGRTLQLRVTHQQTKQAVTGATTEYARSWAARLPDNGDYDVEIVRRAPYCDPPIEYLLTIALQR